MEEKLLWKGSPSQWLNLPHYIFWLLLPLILFIFFLTLETDLTIEDKYLIWKVPLYWFFLGILICLWRYFLIRTWRIKISDQRHIQKKGVLNITTDELELFRVKDIRLEQPFLFRFVGLSNIILTTSDKTHPYTKIPAIKNGAKIREALRGIVEKRREIKGVREADVDTDLGADLLF